MCEILYSDGGLESGDFGSASEGEFDGGVVGSRITQKVIAHQDEEAEVEERPAVVTLLGHEVEVTEPVDLLQEGVELEVLDGLFEFGGLNLLKLGLHVLSKFIRNSRVLSIS